MLWHEGMAFAEVSTAHRAWCITFAHNLCAPALPHYHTHSRSPLPLLPSPPSSSDSHNLSFPSPLSLPPSQPLPLQQEAGRPLAGPAPQAHRPRRPVHPWRGHGQIRRTFQPGTQVGRGQVRCVSPGGGRRRRGTGMSYRGVRGRNCWRISLHPTPTCRRTAAVACRCPARPSPGCPPQRQQWRTDARSSSRCTCGSTW